MIEKALSVDNVFVFLVIFGTFSVPPAYQHRVLTWGVIGALVLRAIFIVAGTAALEAFHGLIYLFGAALLLTGIRLLVQREREEHPEHNPLFRLFQRLVPTASEYDGAKFFTRVDGRRMATPLFAVLMLIEITDVVFAVDSIPAIFAVTRDPFIVFTSNIFAMLGLRALYFCVAGFVERLRYLKVGLALVLVFVAIKMLISDFYKVPIQASLGAVFVLLGGATAASLLAPQASKSPRPRSPMKRTPSSTGAPLTLIIAFAVALGSTPAGAGETSRFSAQVEGGAVWQTRNDVRVPNDATGTRFPLVDLVGTGPWPSGRAYLTWRAGERHVLRVLFAPLSFTGTGVPDPAIAFAGETYASGTPVEATYKFNSYRLTYRYRIHEGERWTWWTGLTAKVRDAKIELRQGLVSSRKTDVGFVPLLHLAAAWRFAPRWRVTLDADALAGGPGRAEDVALTLGRDLGKNLALYGGYRTVEGGADVDEVYAFAWLHYTVAGLEYRF